MPKLALAGLTGFAGVAVLAGAVAAGPLEDGFAAYERTDYAEAIRLMRPLAERGDADAQYRLGTIYDNGLGVPLDDAEAAKWYRLAAEQGDVDAQYYLGIIYYHGEGVLQDYIEAVKWFRLAAEQGDDDAQFSLGVMYDDDEGATQDDAEAVKWYRLAAEQGNADASNNLGLMYAKGEGVPQNDAEAARLYRLAAEQGNSLAQRNLGAMYAAGRGVAQDDAQMVKWYRRAGEQGDANAQYNLGIIYANGYGVPQDMVLAHMWLNLAAAQGDKNAREDRDAAADRMTPEQLAEAQGLAREWEPEIEPPTTRGPLPIEATPNETPGQSPGATDPQIFSAAGGARVEVASLETDGQALTAITIEGELKPGDSKSFAQAAISTERALVVLSSPGGDLNAGIEIGKAIRLKEFGTLVPEGFSCASACALAWLAGQPRYMERGARIGFHAPWKADDPGLLPDSAGSAAVGAYLNQLGLSARAIEYITESKPADMNWLNFEDAERLGIEVKAFRPLPQGLGAN